MTLKNITFALLAGSLLLGAAIGRRAPDSQGPKPLPIQPVLEPVELVDAQAFVLDQPFVHYWRAEQPQFNAGYLLVLRADPDFLRSRQAAEPVLYVGAETAERLNNPETSGHLVCLVPAQATANGVVQLNPLQTPIWFGAPELPEQVDAQSAQRALQLALSMGAGPLPLVSTQRTPGKAQQLTSSTHYASNRSELDLAIADLLERYSPAEQELIAALRVPVTR